MAQATVAEEEYLQTMFWLQEAGLQINGANIRIFRSETEAEASPHYLKQTGLHPGLEGELESSDEDEVGVTSGEGRHPVSKSVAETVSVRADPAPPPRAPLPDQLVISSD